MALCREFEEREAQFIVWDDETEDPDLALCAWGGPEVGAGTAGSFDGMHCELVDTWAGKPDAVIWGHGHGIVVD